MLLSFSRSFASALSSQGIGKKVLRSSSRLSACLACHTLSNSDLSRKLIGQTHLSTACVSSSIGSP